MFRGVPRCHAPLSLLASRGVHLRPEALRVLPCLARPISHSSLPPLVATEKLMEWRTTTATTQTRRIPSLLNNSNSSRAWGLTCRWETEK